MSAAPPPTSEVAVKASPEEVARHAASLQDNPGALESLLLLCTDATQVKYTEDVLKQYTKSPSSVTGLLQQLRSSQHIEVRMQSAVLLRRRMVRHWEAFTVPQQNEIKAAVLGAIDVEVERTVRNQIAAIMAQLAEQLFDVDGNTPGWTELLVYVNQCAQSPDEGRRELAFVILLEMEEVVASCMKQHLGSLKSLFLTALADPSSKVQVKALTAATALLRSLSFEKEALMFKELIPPSIVGAKACLARNDEDAVLHILDVFSDLAQSNLPLINNQNVSDVIMLTLEIVRNENLEISTRDAATMVLCTLAEAKPRLLCRTRHVPLILQNMMELIAAHEGSVSSCLYTLQPLRGDLQDGEGNDDDEDEGDDGEERNTHSIAQACLDCFALNLPTKHVFQPCMELCSQGLASSNMQMRKAGVAVLGVIVEGCWEPMKAVLPDVLPKILQVAGDTEPLVRECACFALGQFSEHCQPEILDYHTEVLPVVFTLLDDATDAVKGISCYVLENFCENLEPETIGPFLDPLMQRLVTMLQTPKRSVQEMSVAAIAATAIAAEESFLPYLKGVSEMMGQMLTISENARMLSLRGRALECMGHIALAVGKESFRPYVEPCVMCAFGGMTLRDPQGAEIVELHEYAYAFFANLSKVLGEDMAPLLEKLVPCLCEVITEDSPFVDADELNIEEEGADMEALQRMLQRVTTGDSDKQKGAMVALASLEEHCPMHFGGYIEPVMSALQHAMKLDWMTELRMQLCTALRHMVGVSVALWPPGPWQKGVVGALPPQVGQLTSVIMDMLMTMVQDDQETATVAAALEALQGVVEEVGPAALQPVAQPLAELVLRILREEAPCQEHVPEEEEGEEEEEEEAGANREGALFEVLGDVIAAMSKVMSPEEFLPFFRVFFPELISKHARGSRPSINRAMAAGAAADALNSLGPLGKEFIAPLLPVVKRGLADGDKGVRCNAAFLAGVMVQSAGESAVPHFMELLQALAPIFQTGDDKPSSVKDNAAAAVARFILVSPPSVPLAQVVPVILGLMPLQKDASENESVYKCVLQLLLAKQPDVLTTMLPQVMSVCARALPDGSGVSEELKKYILESLKTAAADGSSKAMEQAMAQLPPAEQQTLVGALAQAGS